MRVVFLDIDGVLNSLGYYRHAHIPGDVPLDIDAVERLDRLVRAARACVVVSSSWRRMFTLPVLRGHLRDHGYLGPVVGKTPWFRDGCRGDEVAAWLTRSRWPVERFVILDDADDMGHLMPHLIQTTFDHGLQDEHVAAAIAALGRDNG